jgi:hypothetical protein
VELALWKIESVNDLAAPLPAVPFSGQSIILRPRRAKKPENDIATFASKTVGRISHRQFCEGAKSNGIDAKAIPTPNPGLRGNSRNRFSKKLDCVASFLVRGTVSVEHIFPRENIRARATLRALTLRYRDREYRAIWDHFSGTLRALLVCRRLHGVAVGGQDVTERNLLLVEAETDATLLALVRFGWAAAEPIPPGYSPTTAFPHQGNFTLA